MEYYSALKSDEILIPVTTWVTFEDILLSKIRADTKEQILSDSTYLRYLN